MLLYVYFLITVCGDFLRFTLCRAKYTQKTIFVFLNLYKLYLNHVGILSIMIVTVLLELTIILYIKIDTIQESIPSESTRNSRTLENKHKFKLS